MSISTTGTVLRPCDDNALRTLDDDALLALVRTDGAEAYRVLVERHVDRVYALAWSMLGDEAQAEQATTDVFVRLWSDRDGLRHAPSSFAQSLSREICRRCAGIRRSAFGARAPFAAQ